jgi:hypothetical protein
MSILNGDRKLFSDRFELDGIKFEEPNPKFLQF